ncbi:L,D-transpeptidase [Levilactobacillus parabrevis]|uniref:ErfK YbiS YcfS YnhG n=1 Tax=Levilactobacillus parabrevis ATCC 53295 TaxID=1267003 RepID=A0A0R1GZ06_9LACO|nr:L,D-transpeptidase [Levilactobacillus parabrevis]KRK39391.1 ErfK YbiS YcfS YnhG [Levilactobacillus parabrevis ATCC 53295]KRO07292.1 ErfK YbiS YcfS YnhG [Levilactobacillus parabrevis]
MRKTKVFIAGLLALLGLTVGITASTTTTQTATASAKTTKAAKTPSWKQPSEKKAYPNLKKHKKAFIKVSIAKQRVYIMASKKKVLYTMICSTGKKSSPTPKGTFHIQNRGTHFYNASSKEGANYWTSFKYWGTYLFHSVPVNAHGKYVVNEAKKLGKRASHGCVRLRVADAHWIYSHVPYKMKVVIH